MLSVLAIDPGETSAYVYAIVGSTDEATHVHIIKFGEWRGVNGLDEVVFSRQLFDNVRVCVIEDYIVYPNRAMSHAGDRVYTAREIGRLEWICHCADIYTVFQMASQAKSTWPNPRLREYLGDKLYKSVSGSPHIKDAVRHLLTYVEHEFKTSLTVEGHDHEDE